MSKGNFRTSSDVCVACGTTAQPIKPYGFDKRQPCYLCDRCSIRLKLPSLTKEESMAKLTKADAAKMSLNQLQQLIHKELGYTEDELDSISKQDIIDTLVDNGTIESMSKAEKLLDVISETSSIPYPAWVGILNKSKGEGYIKYFITTMLKPSGSAKVGDPVMITRNRHGGTITIYDKGGNNIDYYPGLRSDNARKYNTTYAGVMSSDFIDN